MEGKAKLLKEYFSTLFHGHVFNNTYIEITAGKETVIRANREGLLLLAEELIKLCECSFEGAHYHLDEYGMAHKCDKPVVITLTKPPWS
jgi:hypothetical protein